MKLIVAICGASGVIYGIRILEELKKKGIETHLVISRWGKETISTEANISFEQVKALANYYYENDSLGSVIASGSFKCDGMIIAPCSMKTLSAVANGYTDSLISRAADVALKEKRKLVLLVRETPLNIIHLENMLKLAYAGAVIMPPVPAFYLKPLTVDEMVNHTVCRALEIFNIDFPGQKRWQGLQD